MFRDVEPLIKQTKEIIYKELARHRGAPQDVTIESDATTVELLFKTFTRHPEYLPRSCGVTFKDNKRVFIEIRGTGESDYDIPALINALEMGVRFMPQNMLDMAMNTVADLVKNKPGILLALICGLPQVPGIVSPFPVPSIRLMMLGELLKRNGDPKLMQDFYIKNADAIIRDCIFTFDDMNKLLNTFKPESPNRHVVLNDISNRPEIISRMIHNQYNHAEAYEKMQQYFPDKIHAYYQIPLTRRGW